MAAEGFGEEDGAVGLLMGFDQGDEESGEGGAGAVEGVGEAVFAVGVFVAEVHAAGLVVAEGGTAGDFEVGFLAGGPDFDVVGFGGAEADVAGAEFDDAVVEAEELEDFFGVAGEGFEGVHGGLGGGDVDELDFVELVHANEAAGAEAGAAGFTTEAGGVGGVVDGEVLVFEDLLAMEVGDGDFGGGDEVEVVFGAVVDLVAELGELAGADEALGFDEERGADLGVAVPGGVEVEEEVDEGALEAGAGAAIDDEGGAGDFGAGFEVEHAVGLAEGDVVFGFEVVGGGGAPAADFGVFFGGGADGTGVVGEVREGEEEIALLGVGGVGFDADFVDAGADAADFGFFGGGVFAVFAADADFFGEAIAVALELLAFGLGGAAGGVDGEDLVDERSERGVAGGEALFDEFGAFAQEADVEHGPGRVAGEVGLSRERWGCELLAERRGAEKRRGEVEFGYGDCGFFGVGLSGG